MSVSPPDFADLPPLPATIVRQRWRHRSAQLKQAAKEQEKRLVQKWKLLELEHAKQLDRFIRRQAEEAELDLQIAAISAADSMPSSSEENIGIDMLAVMRSKQVLSIASQLNVPSLFTFPKNQWYRWVDLLCRAADQVADINSFPVIDCDSTELAWNAESQSITDLKIISIHVDAALHKSTKLSELNLRQLIAILPRSDGESVGETVQSLANNGEIDL